MENRGSRGNSPLQDTRAKPWRWLKILTGIKTCPPGRAERAGSHVLMQDRMGIDWLKSAWKRKIKRLKQIVFSSINYTKPESVFFLEYFLGLQKIKSVYLIFQYKTVPPDAVIIYSDSINFSLHSMHNTFIFFVARNELPQHGHKYFRVLEGFWF